MIETVLTYVVIRQEEPTDIRGTYEWTVAEACGRLEPSDASIGLCGVRLGYVTVLWRAGGTTLTAEFVVATPNSTDSLAELALVASRKSCCH